jgi:ubiquinone/menaquinone biosynthesis C-methylase UbiE
MDAETLQVYDGNAGAFAGGYRATEPDQLYTLARAIFRDGQPTADIGTGSGRDTQWLSMQGFPTEGFDASDGMLDEARRAYPHCQFNRATLPGLDEIPSAEYTNVFCSAVLMHVPREELLASAMGLRRILRPGGRLLLSLRSSRSLEEREPDGRLFTTLPLGELELLLESIGLRVLLRATAPDAKRADITWQTIAAERTPEDTPRGVDRIQAVLVQDRKTATYKPALIRALAQISQVRSRLARWDRDVVRVPAWAVAMQWLTYYWHLMAHPKFVSQIRGEQENGSPQLAFRPLVREMVAQYGAGGLALAIRDMERAPWESPAIQSISSTIRKGPVTYAGPTHLRLFKWNSGPPSAPTGFGDAGGWIRMSESVWLDFSRFGHWIAESVVLRWAELTFEMNPTLSPEETLGLLLWSPSDERDTREVIDYLRSLSTVKSVWTGENIARFDVDHLIPYSVWQSNDLWNLLPCEPRLNNQKSDSLPTGELLQARHDVIANYWQEYAERWPGRFREQISRALGCSMEDQNWTEQAFAGLRETVERLATSRGLSRWQPTPT